ncbi:MAG TPA: glycosyltransferase family 4 protein [Xanthobacteraceae bacterium]|nr:glycosyltransferase family 4 protein [Xanthobacteraceae bacterium]
MLHRADQSDPHAPIDSTQSHPALATSLKPLTALIVTPSLHAGAADTGAVQLARILASAGHRLIVVSSGGRLVDDVIAAGATFVPMKVDSVNPIAIARNALALARIVRTERCDVIHAHARAPAWSAYYAAKRTGVPFLTSWYKGFRQQNIFKRAYNGVMARGDYVVAISDQIAELVVERYGTPWDRITVIPASVDFERFDPARVSPARIDAVRSAWGVQPDTKIVMVVGRMVRRKGHHVVVEAVRRLKEMGLKDFMCVFVGEDQGKSRYSGELWDQVLATGTTEVIRMAGPTDDLPAAFAASTVVVSAAIQPEGLQRAILEAEAMARPVVVSDLGAGPDAVLAPPAVADDRMTGLRFSAGDSVALATSLVRLFSLPPAARAAIGARGRGWVLANFNAAATTEPTLRLYEQVASRDGARRRP